jgi:hypothetical protein
MTSPLESVLREIERHVADKGWDQPPRLFALAPTRDLVRREPALAEAMGLDADSSVWTPIEQDPLDPDRPLDEALAAITWPDDVAGAALVLERLVLPPSAEAALPDNGSETEVVTAAAQHPNRQEVRMAVAAVREGGQMCALRLRTHDQDDAVVVGSDLVPRLAEAIGATLTN